MRIVTFGEIMLRLAPEGNLRFLQEPRFEATFGGGEANVAVSLARFGAESAFVTKLPNNDIAEAAVRQLRFHGVDVSGIARGGDRLGIYYMEKGASQRPSKVIYDRAHSAVSEASVSDFDFDALLKDADWFHFTGITPALSEKTAALTLEAVKIAKRQGITVSCDLNYRKNLWSTQQANSVMSRLMEYTDVLIGNEEDADKVFGIRPEGGDVDAGKLNRAGYGEIARKLADIFGLKAVAFTLRESVSASDNNWGAMLFADGWEYFSRTYPVRIVDRVGGGDSFCAALIYAMLGGKTPMECVEFAAAASALKHTIEGDFNLIGTEEAEALARGDAGGRIRR